jgi:hypothetical protein
MASRSYLYSLSNHPTSYSDRPRDDMIQEHGMSWL